MVVILLVFFGRFRVRWGMMGPSSPNPSFFGLLLFLFVFFCWGGECFGRFRVRWGPTSPNLSLHLFLWMSLFWVSVFREIAAFLYLQMIDTCFGLLSCSTHLLENKTQTFIILLSGLWFVVGSLFLTCLPPKPSF